MSDEHQQASTILYDWCKENLNALPEEKGYEVLALMDEIERNGGQLAHFSQSVDDAILHGMQEAGNLPAGGEHDLTGFNEAMPVATEQQQIAPDYTSHDTALNHQHQEPPLPEGGFRGVTGKRTGPGFYGDGTGSS
jgi:hypothetical protein